MAFTESNWMWETQELQSEISRSYGVNRTRRNYNLVRRKYSNLAYTSEDGDTSSSLTAYSALGADTVTAPLLTNLLGFNATTNWCTTSQIWIPTGQTANGAGVYVPNGANIPNASAINVLFRCKIVTTKAGSESIAYAWRVAEMGATDLANISQIETDQDTITAYSYTNINYGERRYPQASFMRSEDDDYDPIGVTIGGTDLEQGQFTGSATVVSKSGQMEFTCVSDVKTIDTVGAPWYTRTQTWAYLEPWT